MIPIGCRLPAANVGLRHSWEVWLGNPDRLISPLFVGN
jgi:hypothetical protein